MEDTNQHYITRAYLDKFVHTNAGQAVLYPYRRGGGVCRPRGTKRLGSAINFYRQRVNGVLSDALDEARTKSETLLFSSGKRNPSSLARCVFEENLALTQQDRLHLAASAAFLFCGSPVQIHNTAMNSLLAQQMWLFNQMATDAAEEIYRESYGEEWETRLEDDRRQVLRGELIADVGEENWKQLGFEAFRLEPEIIRLLLGMRMTVVDCHPQGFFLTSDNPVVRTYPTDGAMAKGRWDDEVWFPISHKRGLLWHRRGLGERTRLGHSESRSMNRRVVKHSYKFVYSPLPADWIGEATKRETADPLVGHYGSLERVIGEARPAIDEHGRPCGEIVDLVAAMRSGERVDILGI